MSTLGILTIGQAPRTDLVPELQAHLSDVTIVERGALDGLSPAEIAGFTPAPGDEVLTSRMADGRSATFGREWILTPLQQQIHELEDSGAEAILLVCTGTFPAFEHTRPLLLAGELVTGGVRTLAAGHQLGVICPLPEQHELTRHKFADISPAVLVADANPYAENDDAFATAAQTLVDGGADVLFLDCMGYDERQRALVRTVVSRPVILARSLVARLSAEMIA